MSQITINLQGADLKQTQRIKRILEILFDQDLFNFHTGTALLHFNSQGFMHNIEWKKKKWDREEFTLPTLFQAFKNFKVSIPTRTICPNCGEHIEKVI